MMIIVFQEEKNYCIYVILNSKQSTKIIRILVSKLVSIKFGLKIQDLLSVDLG